LNGHLSGKHAFQPLQAARGAAVCIARFGPFNGGRELARPGFRAVRHWKVGARLSKYVALAALRKERRARARRGARRGTLRRQAQFRSPARRVLHGLAADVLALRLCMRCVASRWAFAPPTG